MRNIGANFLSTALRLPDQLFLVDREDQVVTYGEALSRARAFQSALADRGVTPGDRVVLTSPNSADYLCSYLGTLLQGATACLVDYGSTDKHLEFVIQDIGARVWASPDPSSARIGSADHLAMAAEPGARSERWLSSDPLIAPSGDALIIYTSGTTGRPKGVRLTHDNLQHTTAAIIEWAKVLEDNREFTTLPLTHLFGLAHVHVHWTVGGSVVVDEGLREPRAVLDRMKRWKPTSFPATPAGVRLLIRTCPARFAEAGTHLRHIIINSAPMKPEDTRSLLALMPGTRCYMYYGLTEASRSTYILYNDHPDHLESVGFPSPGCEVRIDDQVDASGSNNGEILLRGPHVSPGYWGEAERNVGEGEWFRTGDLGRQDADGFVTWMGRVKEQINVDGKKVAPEEVEESLREHGLVDDCVVVGCPDDIYGEVVVAFVVAKMVTDDLPMILRRHCRDRLERHKIPRKVGFISEVPRTRSGKVQRLQLRDRARELP